MKKELNVYEFSRIFIRVLALVLCVFSFLLGALVLSLLMINVSTLFAFPLIIYLSLGFSVIAYMNINNIYLW